MRYESALGRATDRLLARLTQRGVVLLDAKHDATCARPDTRTLLLHILAAGFQHVGYAHERRSARLAELLKMGPDALDQWTRSRGRRGTGTCHVPAARLYHPHILAQSGGCREQRNTCKSQTTLGHVTLRSCRPYFDRVHATVTGFRKYDKIPPTAAPGGQFEQCGRICRRRHVRRGVTNQPGITAPRRSPACRADWRRRGG